VGAWRRTADLKDVAGNVDGKTDVASGSFGAFNASLDISLWQSGLYCFVLNSGEGYATGSCLTQYFYIMDEYAKVGGTIYVSTRTSSGQFAKGRH
jgi:hypothetical protein